jgi:parallel beta-helix repeat protein
MPLVDGLEIVGRHAESIGIEASGTMELTLTRVMVREALHGIHLYNRNRNIIISECNIYNNSGIGIFLDAINMHQINITNSHISYNGGGGIVVRDGDVHNLQIGSCDIECNMTKTGPPTANVLIDVSNGALLEGAIVGCTIQHDNLIPGSSNIRFIGQANKRTQVGNISIGDNNLSETEENVHIKYGRGVIISGNTFYMGTKHNILIEQSEQILMSSNIFDKNPHYGSKTMSTNDNIAVIESSNITINGLHVSSVIGKPAGILIERCKNYNLTNSTILNCNFAGILVKDSENGKISGNFINDDRIKDGKPIAIDVQGGKNNFILNNFTNGIINAKKDDAIMSENHIY